MGYGIQETVLPFVASDFTDQKNSVYDQSGDDHAKKNDAQNQRHHLTPVKYNPTDIEDHGQGDQASAQGDKKRDGLGSSGYAHGGPCAHSNGTQRKIKTASRPLAVFIEVFCRFGFLIANHRRF
jgi:hypothetical protein